MTTTTLLYNDEVVLDFDPDRHRYTANGVPCQGVTGCLGKIAKPALLFWAVNQACDFISANLKPGVALDEVEIKRLITGARGAHRKTSGEASDIGTMAHKFMELTVKGGKPGLPVNPLARAACEAFLGWLNSNHVVVHQSERVVYSRKHHYAGTVDLVGTVNGREFIIDGKSSKALYHEMRFQLSAYKNALVEEGAVPEDVGRMVLRFAKDGSGFHVHELPPEDHAADLGVFLAMLTTSARLNILEAAEKKLAT